MARLIFLLVFVFPLFCFGQDSINHKKDLFYFDDVDYILTDTSIFGITVERANGLPINGWLTKDFIKSIWVEHYTNGVEDGLYVIYELRKGRYYMTRAGFYFMGLPSDSYYFDFKEQIKEPGIWNRGLKKIIVHDPNPIKGNTPSRRTIKYKRNFYKIIDWYYFVESKRSFTNKYKTEALQGLYHHNYKDSIYKIFPAVLNSWNHPFTHLRFDGYYRIKTADYIENIRFYPDSTMAFFFQMLSDSTELNWENESVKNGYFTLCNNQFEFRSSDDEIYGYGKFYYSEITMITIRLNKQGINGTYNFEFVPVSDYAF